MPLIGYAYRNHGQHIDTWVKEVLEEESVLLKDFYLKEMPELSVEGDFRSAPLLSNVFNWSLDENSKVKIKTVLYRGSYATILLREIMKPKKPNLVGF